MEIIGLLPGEQTPPTLCLLSWIFHFGHNWLLSECCPQVSEVPFFSYLTHSEMKTTGQMSGTVGLYYGQVHSGCFERLSTFIWEKGERTVLMRIIRVSHIFLKSERKISLLILISFLSKFTCSLWGSHSGQQDLWLECPMCVSLCQKKLFQKEITKSHSNLSV